MLTQPESLLRSLMRAFIFSRCFAYIVLTALQAIYVIPPSATLFIPYSYVSSGYNFSV